jgi:hypothetical protein
VAETARSLAAFLQTHAGVTAEILDDEFPPAESLRIAGITAPGELAVPAFWFQPHVLVTVAAARPSPRSRIAAVLDAQAAILQRLGNPHAPGDLVYEAHRLAASDLAVACGHVDAADPTSRAWWMAASSDVAVDWAVATAAGVAPEALPWLRVVARHEVLPAPPTVRGTLPSLRGLAAAGWRSRAAAMAARLRASRATAERDARMLRRNLHKIPSFVRRRFARLRRAGGAA